ncbi:Transcriptional regulatory protein ZraR [Enhygromyxa salina]|uniref:Transcriptional regulatory protein ZraR n=1 Tax=Enhygromyxa salina TaxID=215803 RepID=A0A2S9YHE5_9BACT|nr:sigma 54-interacting transcriptional regulator [Enhygromyxa salina]PRQ04534.1 Transcriptional regulatory protein ZraR [Enhygromyxa salina]
MSNSTKEPLSNGVPQIDDDLDPGMTTTFFSAPHRHTQLRRVMLRVTAGPDQGAQIQVARPRITVGRSAVNDLVLTDTSVSGTHLQITLGDKRGIVLRDLESTNGTLLQGLRVREAYIEPGATISLGKTDILFLSADEIEVPLSGQDHFGALWGASPAMREVFAILEKVAPTDMSVMIGGQTGTGKELVARALHDESSRAEAPFVVLDCGSLPRELAEAAILGHKKGSFTGAIGDRPGAFEEADGGTLFLDEVGELPLDLQPKLLRVLDRREVQRIGESQVRKVNVRVVAATHRDLRQMVGQGQFREDLYFRLSVMTVDLPPLRDRADDILLLANKFLEDFARVHGRAPQLNDDAKAILLDEPWPGNVRQLKNAIERAAHLSHNLVIEPADLHLGRREGRPAAKKFGSEDEAAASQTDGELPEEIYAMPFKEAKSVIVDDFERAYFKRLLAKTDNNLSRASAEAGITRYYLRELLKRLGMHKSSKKKAATEKSE